MFHDNEPYRGSSVKGPRAEFDINAGSRILVVEDDVPLANFLQRELQAESYHVDAAHAGQSAHESLLKDKYDLVLLDLNLPKLDSVGLLRVLRPSQPKLPVLVLTARNRC